MLGVGTWAPAIDMLEFLNKDKLVKSMMSSSGYTQDHSYDHTDQWGIQSSLIFTVEYTRLIYRVLVHYIICMRYAESDICWFLMLLPICK